MNKGDIIHGACHDYEFVRDGCLSGSTYRCPNTDPIEVFVLDKNGNHVWGMTTCIERPKS